MLPDQPSTFDTPQAPGLPWWWRLETSTGEPVIVEGYSDQRFATQGDAESWVGEIWADLAEHGAAAVTLFENERQVYGPMSLSA